MTAKRLKPKYENDIAYVTWKMIKEHHGEEWANQWSKAAGVNTMIMVDEDNQKVGGIYVEDYERFADLIDHGKPTYWD